uniref:Uncharacterized protein n=1 Tax=Caulerpa verticillata TaxID=177082 RepID=A0A386B0D5_9CHLO|nr:hypothetical protein [Caulerpa verticillata]AYC65151.1 hypothetical protein [Caulerpa verticillata]
MPEDPGENPYILLVFGGIVVFFCNLIIKYWYGQMRKALNKLIDQVPLGHPYAPLCPGGFPPGGKPTSSRGFKGLAFKTSRTTCIIWTFISNLSWVSPRGKP